MNPSERIYTSQTVQVASPAEVQKPFLRLTDAQELFRHFQDAPQFKDSTQPALLPLTWEKAGGYSFLLGIVVSTSENCVSLPFVPCGMLSPPALQDLCTELAVMHMSRHRTSSSLKRSLTYPNKNLTFRTTQTYSELLLWPSRKRMRKGLFAFSHPTISVFRRVCLLRSLSLASADLGSSAKAFSPGSRAIGSRGHRGLYNQCSQSSSLWRDVCLFIIFSPSRRAGAVKCSLLVVQKEQG